jgi:hypothetical protein
MELFGELLDRLVASVMWVKLNAVLEISCNAHPIVPRLLSLTRMKPLLDSPNVSG